MTEPTQMPNLSYFYQGRYLCTVLEEMRTCCNVLNFAPMMSLIEEAQILGNRMESALEEYGTMDDIQKDLQTLREARRKLKKEVRELIKERDSYANADDK